MWWSPRSGERTPLQQLKRNVCPLCYATPAKTYTVPATENEDKTISIIAQPVFGIDPNHEPIDSYMKVRSVPGGTVNWLRDDTANDSDKTFTVPAGKVWEILMLSANIVATATVGNRTVVMLVNVAGGAVLAMCLGAAVAATAAGAYVVGPGVTNSTTIQDYPLYTGFVSASMKSMSIPTLYLPAGATIRIYDIAAIDPAADDMTVVLEYVEYDA